MKTALIFFHSGIEEPCTNKFSEILSNFYLGGIKIDTVEMLAFDDDIGFKHRLTDLKNTADNLIVCYSERATFDIKKIIADCFDQALVENENAKKFVDAVSNSNSINYNSSFAQMPIDATVIPNLTGAFQGFMVEENDFSLVVLPEEQSQLKVMCSTYVVPYFETKYGISPKKLTFKYFGEEKHAVNVLNQALEQAEYSFKFFTKEENKDVTITIFFDEGVTKVVADNAIRFIVGELKENIYAEFDTTLGARLYDLLKLRRLKISTAESFTGGRVINAIISNAGASTVVDEGVVSYSNDSKISRLKVKESDLNRVGAVSSQVACQMALGLLLEGKCDVAIATTGIAGPNSDNTQKPVGLGYIAVGMRDGVHSYKFNFEGDREKITETAKNTALFLAIKKLKTV